jgi:hypothetical protein
MEKNYNLKTIELAEIDEGDSDQFGSDSDES